MTSTPEEKYQNTAAYEEEEDTAAHGPLTRVCRSVVKVCIKFKIRLSLQEMNVNLR